MSNTGRHGATLRAAAVALMFALLLCGCATRKTNLQSATFRVMTYNIHHGEGTDGRIDLLRLAEVINQEGADIVALQEVDKGVERTKRRDLPAELAALTGMTCVFSNNFYFQGGEYGNAVLTRFPVLRAGEQRGLLQLLVDVNGRHLLFMNTHIDYRPDPEERLLNVEEIKRVAGHYGRLPVILCGDFNDTPGSLVHQKLKEQFMDSWEAVGQGDGFTYSSDRLIKRIDYVFLSAGSPLVPLKSWVPQSDASDHLPLVVELRMK